MSLKFLILFLGVIQSKEINTQDILESRHGLDYELKEGNKDPVVWKYQSILNNFVRYLNSWNFQPILIANAGYPVEVHQVVTDDGYILEMHRIPFGKRSPLEPGVVKPAVYLQHGLTTSSADWVMGYDTKALGKKIEREKKTFLFTTNI